MTMNKKIFFRGFTLAVATLMIISAGLLAGCTAKGARANTDSTSGQVISDSKEMADFNALLAANPKVTEVIAFINQNISKLPKENASVMLIKLEEIQQKELPGLENRYYTNETVQGELQKLYMKDFDLNKLDETQNDEVKKLLAETKEMGFKVETAEGMFFPVMNYEFYKNYSTYATEDMKEYIELMAVESNKTPIKDAALMIGWDEIIERALAQEQFIKNNGGSAKADAVKLLHNRYVTFLLFGANNTPLFSYNTKGMNADAQTAYASAVKDNPDSELMQMLKEYMDILSKTDYKFSDEADQFRKNIADKNGLQ